MRRLRVKLTSAWPDAQASLGAFLKPNGFAARTCDFFLDDVDCKSADVWIVLDQVVTDHDAECSVYPGCFIIAMNETAHPMEYFVNYPARMHYLRQFDATYSFYALPVNNLTLCPPFLPWMIDSNHEVALHPQLPNVATLQSAVRPVKTKVLSIITSDKIITPAQRQRLRFAELVSKALGSDVEWFGAGINAVDTKRDAIESFKFHLAMENRIQPYIISEKLFDGILGWSLPIYWGAPNADRYLPSKSFVAIDAARPESALRMILTVLDQDLQNQRVEALQAARAVVLGPMNWIERLAHIAMKVFLRRKGLQRTPHLLAVPSIASHVGYRELNSDIKRHG